MAPVFVNYTLNCRGWCAWSVEDSLKQWLPNGKLLLLSHKMPWCVLLTTVKNYNKSLEKNCKTFSSKPRPRPRPNVQDQDFMIQDQDQDFHFCPRGASRVETNTRAWSRGLHHCKTLAGLVPLCIRATFERVRVPCRVTR